jgi:formate-dependent nitrite reductase membrane component NrfD
MVLGAFAVGFIATMGMRRVYGAPAAPRRNEVIGMYLMLASALLGTYLGFLTVAVWETRAAAETAARIESADLLTLLRLSDTRSGSRGASWQTEVLRYTRSIAEVEWPRMGSGNTAEVFRRSAELDALWAAILAQDARNRPFASNALDRLVSLASARESRLLGSTMKLSPYIWLTVIAGALLNLALLMLMRVEEAGLHATVVGCCAALVGVLLWGIYDMQSPYDGSWAVSSAPFFEAAKQMEILIGR